MQNFVQQQFMNNQNIINSPNNMNMNMQNNFNMMNNFGLPNQQIMMMPQVNVQNWLQMYTQNQPNFGANTQNNKLTVIFKTGRGLITTIYIDYGKTVNYLIQVYFLRIGHPEYINRPKDIGFLYNAKLINFNEPSLVENYFSGVTNATITVNDIGDLIGA